MFVQKGMTEARRFSGVGFESRHSADVAKCSCPPVRPLLAKRPNNLRRDMEEEDGPDERKGEDEDDEWIAGKCRNVGIVA